MNSTSTVSLDDIQTAVYTSRALIIVILGVLVLTLVVRTAIFFIYRKKTTNQSCQKNCNCNKQPTGVVLQPPFIPRKSDEKQTESSSMSSRKSTRKEKKNDDGKKKKTTQKRTRKDVDLEKGENIVDKNSMAMREATSSKEDASTAISKEDASTTISKEDASTAMSPTRTAVAASPAPHPLLTGEAPLGEATPPVAAAVDSLIVCSAIMPVPVDTHQTIPHSVGPSTSMASTFDNKKNTAV